MDDIVLLYSFRCPVNISLFNPNSYTFFHRAAACCRGIKLLLIRRSRLALVARLRRFCVCLGYIGATLYG